MLEYLATADDVIAIRCGGKLSRAELESMVERIESALEANEKTHIYAEVRDFSGFETEGFGELMKRSAGMLGKLRRFGRIAVVADQAWLRWAAKLESALLPHVSYETFELKDSERALAWVEGREALPRGPAIKLIDTDRPSVFGFELDGKATKAELDAVSAHFNARLGALEEDEKVGVLGRIRHLGGFEMGGIFSGDYFAMKRGFLEHMDRYAIVGGPAWMRAALATLDPLFKAELRWFEPDQEDEAWDWLGANPVAERTLVA